MDPCYQSEINRDVPPARPGEFAPVSIGPLEVWPPVLLAPMAGVTNAPFRTLCRQFGAGLYVSEMITARAFVEGNRKTLHLTSFAPDETVRSLQLYGVDPHYVGEAVKILLTVALMIAAIRVLQVEMLPFMLGYIAIYVVYWMALKTGFPWIKARD